MGIHGLTGFIDNNQHLLHQHQLHDCSVVLDGNNFYHFLYYACHVQCSFGGDYDIFRKKIISTFSSFKTCGITPYVVMDGAYTVDGRKLKTSLSRASARIRLVDVMANNQRGQALPVLAYETFMQTLNELQIHHVTCQFEADNEIAVLANKLQCPVISNDSDFYIFDLSNGFLPMDYLDFRPLEKQTSDATSSFHYLHCHKYHIDDFINSFDGLSRSVLPIFASLLGNDFINARAFSTFYSRVKVPKVISKKFSLPPRLSKVICALHWLNTHSDSMEFPEIKNELLEYIKPRRRNLVEKLFVSSVNGYTDVENFQGFDLLQYFTVGYEQCQSSSGSDFCSYNRNDFPDWFTKAVCCGKITPSIMNCVILHRVILLTQVEDLSQPSSFSCSLGLRRIIYGILLQEDHLKTDTIDNQNNEHTDMVHPECISSGQCLENVKTPSEGSYVQTLSHISNLVEENNVQEGSKACGGERDDDFVGEDTSEVRVIENGMLAGGVKTKDGWKKVKQFFVEEYTRVNKNLLKSYVEPLYKIGTVSLPSLMSLTTMSQEDRKVILMESLGVDQNFMSKFSEDLQLFAACLVLWSRNTSPKITNLHLETVIAGVIMLRTVASLTERRGDIKDVNGKVDLLDIKCDEHQRREKCERDQRKEKCDELIKKRDGMHELGKEMKEKGELYSIVTVTELMKQNSGQENENTGDSSMLVISQTPNKKLDITRSKINIRKVCSESDIQELEYVRQNLNKYHTKSPTFNNKHHYNPCICHMFAQMQACIADAVNLNKLLRFPVPNLRPADLINGTFLYNFFVDISERTNTDLFLAAMLGRNSDLFSTFELFRGSIIDHVGKDFFVSPASLSKKPRKRKTKCKNKEKAVDENRPENSDDKESSVGTVSGFDVKNMFSVLSLED